MGTNVYAIKKNPRSLIDWDKLSSIADNKDYCELEDILQNFKEARENNSVHLGKRSAGWKFLFDPNNWTYYDHTESSISKFLDSCWAIQDEYGDTYTQEEFWKDFAKWNPGGMTGKEYYSKESNYSPTWAEAYKENYYESRESPAGKISEDLPYRFSNSTGFS